MQTTIQSAPPLKLDVFIDFVCPWCYLAHGVIEKLRETHALEVSWQPFPLHPSTPEDGMLLSDLFKGANIDDMHARLYTMMDELQLPHCDRDKLFNTRKAQELAIWADTQGKGDELIKALFHAYFAENRNLADDEVLIELAGKSGLDTAQAAVVLQERPMAEQVDLAWQKAGSLQIGGVPAFLGGGYLFSGYQPLEEMERFLEAVNKATTSQQ